MVLNIHLWCQSLLRRSHLYTFLTRHLINTHACIIKPPLPAGGKTPTLRSIHPSPHLACPFLYCQFVTERLRKFA